MVNIQPFRALRPRPDLAQRVASRPYDVMNSEEARKEASGNAESYLHITKSEIDLSPNIDVHSQDVYDRAKLNLDQFVEQGILFQDQRQCYYIYTLVWNGKAQTGLVCVSSLADYESGVIKKHELTRPEKELDRVNHIKATGAQTGNVFLAFRTHERLNKEIEDWKSSHHPFYDFIADDGIQHMVWTVDDNSTIDRITEYFRNNIDATYIADGHHRAASAARVNKESGMTSHADTGYFLTTLFPADQLHILDYNRVVKDLNGLTADGFVVALQQKFIVGKVADAVRPENLHEFGMYLSGNWYKLLAKPGIWADDPIGRLDVSILQENVLNEILGIKDVRTDKRIDFVGGMRGLVELQNRVDSGEMKVAFSLYPVSIGQLFEIADSGNVMPPKSTWFEPKLRDGLFTHLFNS